MVTDMQLLALKPAQKIYKVPDQRGLYAAVTPLRPDVELQIAVAAVSTRSPDLPNISNISNISNTH